MPTQGHRQTSEQVLAASAVVAVTTAVAVLRRRITPPPIKIHASDKLKPLLHRLPTLLRGHRPAPLVPTGMLQSATVDAYNPSPEATPWQREEIRLAAHQNVDRTIACCPPATPPGLVSLDWLRTTTSCESTETTPTATVGDGSAGAPICLLIPSLTGDSRSPYLRRAAVALQDAGMHVACYNPRGRGGNPLLSPFMYAAGYTQDLRRVVDRIRATHPRSPLVAVGYSLGGVYLAKLLAEDGESSPLAGAAALASPVDIDRMARHLQCTWLGRLIDRLVIAPTVRATLAPYVQTEGAIGDLEAARSAWTLRLIDEGVLAPMMGCESKEQYYRESTPTLGHIRVPLLLLQAENDPIKPSGLQEDLERACREGTAPLLLAVTKEGGHSLTWPEGWRAESSWSERLLIEWVRACCGDGSLAQPTQSTLSLREATSGASARPGA